MSYETSEKQFLQKLGQRIRSLREAKGLSQEKLSFECGLHRTYISSVERGERNIAIINLKKIASSLDVSLSQLFDGLDSNEDTIE
jgi:transcriptional regulator with XRE-family HTH domain